MGFIGSLDFDKFKAPPAHTEGRDDSLENINTGNENHSFDLSTRDALNTLNADKNDGDGKVGGKTFGTALNKLADGGQVSREEYADIREWVTKNYASMDDDAKKLWDKFDTAYQKASGGDVSFGDKANDGKVRSDAVLSGEALKSVLKDINTDKASGYKPPHEHDGVHPHDHKKDDWAHTKPDYDRGRGREVGHGPSGTEGAGGTEHGHHAGGSSGTKGSGGSSGSSGSGGSESTHGSGGSKGASGASGAEGGSFEGMSWEMIFALIMDKIDNAEKMAKGKAKELANKMDANTKAIQGHSEAQSNYDTELKGWQEKGSDPNTKPVAPKEVEAGQGTESMNRDMSELQSFLDNLNKLVNMLTNLQKNKHDTEMAVVRNLAG